MASRAMHRIGLTLLLSMLVATPLPAQPQRAILSDITVSNSPDHLLLHVNVRNAFNQELRQKLLNGTPILFEFQVQLKRVKALWRNETIADIEASQSIRYDAIRREFIVRRVFEREPEMTSSSEEALARVSRLDGLKLAPLQRIAKGEPYQLKVKAAVGRRSLPLGLHHVLFFMSFWDVETDWVIIDFNY